VTEGAEINGNIKMKLPWFKGHDDLIVFPFPSESSVRPFMP